MTAPQIPTPPPTARARDGMSSLLDLPEELVRRVMHCLADSGEDSGAALTACTRSCRALRLHAHAVATKVSIRISGQDRTPVVPWSPRAALAPEDARRGCRTRTTPPEEYEMRSLRCVRLLPDDSCGWHDALVRLGKLPRHVHVESVVFVQSPPGNPEVAALLSRIYWDTLQRRFLALRGMTM